MEPWGRSLIFGSICLFAFFLRIRQADHQQMSNTQKKVFLCLVISKTWPISTLFITWSVFFFPCYLSTYQATLYERKHFCLAVMNRVQMDVTVASVSHQAVLCQPYIDHRYVCRKTLHKKNLNSSVKGNWGCGACHVFVRLSFVMFELWPSLQENGSYPVRACPSESTHENDVKKNVMDN